MVSRIVIFHQQVQEIVMTLKDTMRLYLGIMYLTLSANCLNYQSAKSPKNQVCSSDKLLHVEALEGEASVMSCDSSNGMSTADGSPVRWYRVSNDSSSQQALEFDDQRVVEDGRAVWFLPSHTEDQGLYVCHLQNEMSCINFTVTKKDNQLCYGRDTSYCSFTKSGKNKRLFCSHDIVQLSEDANVTWFKDCNAIDRSPAPSRGNELTIYNVTTKDSGKYTCEVHFQKFGRHHKASKTFTLQVKEFVLGKTPDIIQPPKNNLRHVSLGQAINITCKVLYNLGHDLYPLVWWTSNGVFIEDNNEENATIESGYRNVSSNETCSVIERTLIIKEVQPRHLGCSFTCFAQNSVGVNSASIRLLQQCSSTCARARASKKALHKLICFVLPFILFLWND